MAEKYVIFRTTTLKAVAPNWDRGNIGAQVLAKTRNVPAREIDVATLDSEAAQAESSKDGTIAIAPVMPMYLIKATKTEVPVGVTAPNNIAWGITAVGADKSKTYDGSGITVAVLDTGIDNSLTHEGQPFHGVELVVENFTDDDPRDTDGHGTHCAGTIFGRETNSIRIGVAPGIKRALIAKVIGSKGASTDAIAKAILWAYDNGAQIISMSLGIDFPGAVKAWQDRNESPEQATSRALLQFRDSVRVFDKLADFVRARADVIKRGVLIVAATGNESRRERTPPWTIGASPPANTDGFLAVAAVAAKGGSYEVAAFSNTGGRVAAPGTNILSADRGGGLVARSGTSMATPHVAGIAALWAQKLGPMADASELMNAIISSATPIAGQSLADVGKGLVQAPTE